MAHEITIRADGYAEMAFVGNTPWHGLGQELDPNADLQTWRKAAGMDWTIERTPVLFESDGLNAIAGRDVLYRSDTKDALSVVSDRYKPVQPAEVLEFFDTLVKENGFRLHTAGTLFGGRRMWALAETGKFGEITKDDGIGGFLLLSTSADKSLATTARFTSVRVVCNNTLSLATRTKGYVSFNHTRHFDHDAMRLKLAAAVGSFEAFLEMGKHLQKQKMTISSAEMFVRNLFEVPVNDNVYDQRAPRKVLSLFSGEAMGFDLVGETKWGMANAVTEYLDHHHPARAADARLNNAWFGTGDNLKARALELLAA